MCHCGFNGLSRWADEGQQYECGSSSGWTHDWQEICPGCDVPVFDPTNYFDIKSALEDAEKWSKEGLQEYLKVCHKNKEARTADIVTSMLLEEFIEEE